MSLSEFEVVKRLGKLNTYYKIERVDLYYSTITYKDDHTQMHLATITFTILIDQLSIKSI